MFVKVTVSNATSSVQYKEPFGLNVYKFVDKISEYSLTKVAKICAAYMFSKRNNYLFIFIKT